MLRKLLGLEVYLGYTQDVPPAYKLSIGRSYDGIIIYLGRYELHVSRTRKVTKSNARV